MKFFLLLVIAIFALSANDVKGQSGCAKLDDKKPTLYIAYERESTEKKNGKENKITLLRLVNNTSCDVFVETDGERQFDPVLYSSETVKINDRLTNTKYKQRRIDGVEIGVFYDVVRRPKTVWIAGNYNENRDISFVYTIFSGSSVTFPVVRSDAKRGVQLSVAFNYEWDDSLGVSNVTHRVYYHWELPKGYYEASSK
ncbi:MAG: hypothetical protein QM785_03700 [Pyrinomonadaceae bacterium]